MTSVLSNFLFSSSARKTLVYYSGFCFLFLFTYLALVSTVSFFHFLLDHEMRVIERWLTMNAWETLILAKMIAAFIVLKALRLNNYLFTSSLTVLKNSELVPERKALAMLFYFGTFFVAMAFQFGQIISNEKGVDFVLTSYLGSILFYLIDFFVIFNLLHHNPLERRRQKILLCIALPALFILVTKSAMPYIETQTLYLALHFGSMTALLAKSKNNMGNIFLYSVLIIGPMSVFFGVDLVWADNYSKYLYPSHTSLMGTFLVWLTGFIYYFRTNQPA